MSKELTPLEALDFIKTSPYRNWKGKVNTINFNFETEIKIIETALKRLETLEEDFMSLTETNMELVQEQARNQKKLKALEIINNKEVAVFFLNKSKDVNDYNNTLKTYGTNQELTQEEYDLLKEVFK